MDNGIVFLLVAFWDSITTIAAAAAHGEIPTALSTSFETQARARIQIQIPRSRQNLITTSITDMQ